MVALPRQFTAVNEESDIIYLSTSALFPRVPKPSRNFHLPYCVERIQLSTGCKNFLPKTSVAP